MASKRSFAEYAKAGLSYGKAAYDVARAATALFGDSKRQSSDNLLSDSSMVKRRKTESKERVGHPSSNGYSIQSTGTGSVETVIWGPNPYPNLVRHSKELSAARAKATYEGISIIEPITDIRWGSGTIWSAAGPDGSGNYTFDYNQGTCAWYSVAAFDVHVADRCFTLAYQDATVDYRSMVYAESYLHELDLCNMYTSPCEVTVFKCWPRQDIPYQTTILATTEYILGENPPLLMNMNQTDYASAIPQQYQCNMTWWDSTPYNNPRWCQLFNITPEYNKILGPGDHVRANFGLTKPQRLTPQEFLSVDEMGNPASNAYAHLKEFGPIYLIRVRGLIVHGDDVVDGKIKGKPEVNYGNFQVGYVHRSRLVCRATNPDNERYRLLGYNIARAPTSVQFPAEQATVVNAPSQMATES